VRASISVVAAGLVLAGAGQASAQGVASVSSPDQMRAKYQISVMEGALERAVQLGAQRLSRQVQAVSSDMLFIATAARAKGFWLETYGVFFDVDVPAMRHSMAWSFRTLDRGGQKVQSDINTLKRNLQFVHDPQAHRDMEAAIQRMERLVGPPMMPPGADPGLPPPGQPGVVQTGTVTASAAIATSAAATDTLASESTGPGAILDDPGSAYTTEVKTALVDAMLDYGTSIPIGENEWLTIAARDNNDSRIGGDDPYDVTTIVLRVKGADLMAFKSGRITRDEAVKKVSIKDY
jgi:hypothetical protein